MPQPPLLAVTHVPASALVVTGPPVLGELRLESFAPVPTVDLGRAAALAVGPLRGRLRALNPGPEPVRLSFDRLGTSGAGLDGGEGWQVQLVPLPGEAAAEPGDGALTLGANGGACLIELAWAPPPAKAAAGPSVRGRTVLYYWPGDG